MPPGRFMKELLVIITAWKLIRRFGGWGLIAIGLVDSLVIPIPGSADALTIILTTHQRALWPYYAAMATIGSVIGGFLTYRIARKGGQESLEKRFSKRKMKRGYAMFEKWGFGSIFIPAMLPPPVPFVPFLLAAGALKYPAKKFVAALILGRSIRFALFAYLASRFGHAISRFFDREYTTILIASIVAAVAIAAGFAVYFIRRRHTTGILRKRWFGAG